MGFQTNYVEAVKRVEDLVQIMFEKLSSSCKYCEEAKHVNQTCLYYGRKGAYRCSRAECPLLEEEE